MPQTTVRTNLLQPLKIITELGVNTVGKNLRVLAVHDVALPVQEPGGDLVLGGALEDGDDTLELFGGEFTSAVESMKVNLAVLVSPVLSTSWCLLFSLLLSVESTPTLLSPASHSNHREM